LLKYLEKLSADRDAPDTNLVDILPVLKPDTRSPNNGIHIDLQMKKESNFIGFLSLR
jgi:hypothetical protein